MTTDIDTTRPLNELIARARATLDNATTAAEILEAVDRASVAYDQAKIAERLAKAKGAHDDMLETCRQMMADAVLIEARAEIRLADEYDAAQKRGEVNTRGHGRKGNIPDENISPTVKDIGLTSKKVHSARKTRDAEKAEPGVIKRTLDKAKAEKRTPSKSEVRRAVDRAINKTRPKAEPRQPAAASRVKANGESRTPVLDRARDIVRPLIWNDQPCNPRKLEAEYDISHVHLETAIAIERVLKDEPPIDASTLSMSAQAALDVVKKNYRRSVEAQIREECRVHTVKWMDSLLDDYRKEQKHLRAVLDVRRGVMTGEEYRLILSCLHPGSRANFTEARLSKAMNVFKGYEKRLVSEKDSPTKMNGLPESVADLLKAKEAMQAKRRAQREASRAANMSKR